MDNRRQPITIGHLGDSCDPKFLYTVNDDRQQKHFEQKSSLRCWIRWAKKLSYGSHVGFLSYSKIIWITMKKCNYMTAAKNRAYLTYKYLNKITRFLKNKFINIWNILLSVGSFTWNCKMTHFSVEFFTRVFELFWVDFLMPTECSNFSFLLLFVGTVLKRIRLWIG